MGSNLPDRDKSRKVRYRRNPVTLMRRGEGPLTTRSRPRCEVRVLSIRFYPLEPNISGSMGVPLASPRIPGLSIAEWLLHGNAVK
jgi:hypothetical protein